MNSVKREGREEHQVGGFTVIFNINNDEATVFIEGESSLNFSLIGAFVDELRGIVSRYDVNGHESKAVDEFKNRKKSKNRVSETPLASIEEYWMGIMKTIGKKHIVASGQKKECSIVAEQSSSGNSYIFCYLSTGQWFLLNADNERNARAIADDFVDEGNGFPRNYALFSIPRDEGVVLIQPRVIKGQNNE